MKSRFRVLVVALLLGAPACGDDGDVETPAGQADDSRSQNFRVQIDGNSPELSAAFESFFPNRLAARPGDTVTFDLAPTWPRRRGHPPERLLQR
jgi:hypothetical protein